MKREHLIIIAVVIFVLVACGFGVLGALVLWPDADPPIGGGGGNTDRTLPRVTDTGVKDTSVFAPVVGVWQCTEGSEHIGAGSVLTFVSAPNDADRLAYWAADLNSAPTIEFRYSLYVQDSFNCALEQTNAPPDKQPYKLKVLVDVLDPNKMELYAFDEHRASAQPAILKRVQQ